MAKVIPRGRPLIRDLYIPAVGQIMAQHNIRPPLGRPNHVVPPDADFGQVVQHTDYWLNRRDSVRYYRYNRYYDVMTNIEMGSNRLVHVDIGCGAGLFSWVVLDRATHVGLSYERVALYGLDHCQAMVDLAYGVRSQFLANVVNYPELHYFTDTAELLPTLTANRTERTDFLITLGHVLVQAHTPRDILKFSRTIVQIVRLMDANARCTVLAVDARLRTTKFSQAWNALLTHLRPLGVTIEPLKISHSNINNESDAKIARLSRTIRVFSDI